MTVGGTDVFAWKCRRSDSCQYGPYSVTFNGQAADGMFCRPSKEERRNIKLNEFVSTNISLVYVIYV